MKESYQYSLDDLDEAPSKQTKAFLDAIDDVRNGIKNSEERLYDFVKNGSISVESYNDLIKRCRDLRIKKEVVRGKKYKETRRKLNRILPFVACAVILCIAILLLLNYHNNEIDASYEIGYHNGYNKGESDGYNDGYKDGTKYIQNLRNEYDFFHNNAVIVTTTGNKYHRYGCQHIKNRPYYIYNIELAKAKGYTPCLDCH